MAVPKQMIPKLLIFETSVLFVFAASGLTVNDPLHSVHSIHYGFIDDFTASLRLVAFGRCIPAHGCRHKTKCS
ncbi:hypothetical protein LENED_007841 [Lentinula edodes]|uniref:Uncharacterized protein n=1 Tax=Lentinula edodes TaxID=5353 RepID=A0A1Q3EFI9_LENED|nr:hypothetical protein LENED_007841 [Lentinula edodes]